MCTQVSKYNIAVGYHTADFQLAVSVLDLLGTVKVGYAHNVNSSLKVNGRAPPCLHPCAPARAILTRQQG